MEQGSMENLKDCNMQIREELHRKYPTFQDFYSEIMSSAVLMKARPQEIKDDIAFTVWLGEPIRSQKQMLDAFQDNIPSSTVNNAMIVIQEQMLKASAFYHGEANLLDKNGSPLANAEWIKTPLVKKLS